VLVVARWERGLAVIWNPLDATLCDAEIGLPLYYAVMMEGASSSIREQEGTAKVVILDRNHTATITATLQPMEVTWFVIE
jgi:hypothetical protein